MFCRLWSYLLRPSLKAGVGSWFMFKLIQGSVIYCLILISDSIMVPCYERITQNTKGSAIS